MGVGCESISPTFLKLGGGVSRTQGLRGRGLCRRDFQVQGGFPVMTLPRVGAWIPPSMVLKGPQVELEEALGAPWQPVASLNYGCSPPCVSGEAVTTTAPALLLQPRRYESHLWLGPSGLQLETSSCLTFTTPSQPSCLTQSYQSVQAHLQSGDLEGEVSLEDANGMREMGNGVKVSCG